MVLRTSGHPLHGLLSEAFLFIWVDCYALWRLVVSEWLRRGGRSVASHLADFWVNSVDVLIGELRLLVNLL